MVWPFKSMSMLVKEYEMNSTANAEISNTGSVRFTEEGIDANIEDGAASRATGDYQLVDPAAIMQISQKLAYAEMLYSQLVVFKLPGIKTVKLIVESEGKQRYCYPPLEPVILLIGQQLELTVDELKKLGVDMDKWIADKSPKGG